MCCHRWSAQVRCLKIPFIKWPREIDWLHFSEAIGRTQNTTSHTERENDIYCMCVCEWVCVLCIDWLAYLRSLFSTRFLSQFSVAYHTQTGATATHTHTRRHVYVYRNDCGTKGTVRPSYKAYFDEANTIPRAELQTVRLMFFDWISDITHRKQTSNTVKYEIERSNRNNRARPSPT